MKVLQQPLGPVQANCYLVMENHHAILIDPADMYPNLEFILKENECTLEAIVLTHAHFDHISGVDKIVDVFHCDVYLNPNEFDFLQDSDLNSSSAFYMDVTCVAKCKPILEGKNTIAGFDIEALHTPGHTEGGSCYYIREIGVIFSGDTLFCGSVGRTDFPGGSMSEIVRSIKEKVMVLPDDTKVYPGHGEGTSVGYERENNPFLVN